MKFEAEHGLKATAERSQGIRIDKDEIEKAQRLNRQGREWTAVPPRLAIGVAVRAAYGQSTNLGEFEDRLIWQKITTRWRYDDQGKAVGGSFGRAEASISGKNAGLSCRMLNLHFGEKGTIIHEQSRNLIKTGRVASLDGAVSGANYPISASRPYGEHAGLGPDSTAIGGLGRGTSHILGEHAEPFKELGELVYQASERLVRMCAEMEDDGARFNRERIRMQTILPRLLVRKSKPKKQEISK